MCGGILTSTLFYKEILHFLRTQNLWEPAPLEAMGEVGEEVSLESSREAALRLRRLRLA